MNYKQNHEIHVVIAWYRTPSVRHYYSFHYYYYLIPQLYYLSSHINISFVRPFLPASSHLFI